MKTHPSSSPQWTDNVLQECNHTSNPTGPSVCPSFTCNNVGRSMLRWFFFVNFSPWEESSVHLNLNSSVDHFIQRLFCSWSDLQTGVSLPAPSVSLDKPWTIWSPSPDPHPQTNAQKTPFLRLIWETDTVMWHDSNHFRNRRLHVSSQNYNNKVETLIVEF